MRSTKACSRRLVPMAMLCVCGWAGPVHSALIVDGVRSAAPGQLITLSIELDAALSVSIDDLELSLEFDPAVLTNPTALPGPLLATSIFTANTATGTGVASFLATATALGPGTLASWTFMINSAAANGEKISLRARLDTFIIDSQPTASLSSDVLTIRIVPEPSFYAFVLAALAALVLLQSTRRGTRSSLSVSRHVFHRA